MKHIQSYCSDDNDNNEELVTNSGEIQEEPYLDLSFQKWCKRSLCNHVNFSNCIAEVYSPGTLLRRFYLL